MSSVKCHWHWYSTNRYLYVPMHGPSMRNTLVASNTKVKFLLQICCTWARGLPEQQSSSEEMCKNLACHSLQTEYLSFPLFCISFGQIHPRRLKSDLLKKLLASISIQKFWWLSMAQFTMKEFSFIFHIPSFWFELFSYLVFSYLVCWVCFCVPLTTLGNGFI